MIDTVRRVVQGHPESASIENEEISTRLGREMSSGMEKKNSPRRDERNLKVLPAVSMNEWNELAVPETNVVHTAAGALHAASTRLE